MTVVADVASFVVVEAAVELTWIEMAVEVDEPRPFALEYTAVIESKPTGRLEVESVATPPLEREADPMTAVPL